MNKKLLPDFFGILEVQHYIQGRMRLKINSLKENKEKSQELIFKLKNLDGIFEVQVNPLIGSVLVKFDESKVDAITLVGAILHILELEDEVFAEKDGKIFQGLRELLGNINLAIYSKTKGILDMKTIIAIFFIYIGVKKIRQNPIMPNGVNLLWWGYNLISKGGKE